MPTFICIRNRARARFASASLLALLPLLVAGCDGGDDQAAVTADLATIPCTSNTFRLTGSIDSMSIDVTQPANMGGFTQLPGGDFDSDDNAPGPNLTATNLHLLWPHNITTGDSEAATGTVKIPTSPFPSETFCVGAGSAVRVSDDGLQFRLRGLASGTGCSVPRTGELRGSWCP
jgi:hypothetical protein